MPITEIYCDACGKQIETQGNIGKFKQGDLEVEYLRCNHCGKKFHIMTTNSELRALIAERKQIESDLKEAHDRRARAKVIRGHIKKLNKLKNKQLYLADGLRVIGTQLLER